jgi:hypothetical protein
MAETAKQSLQVYPTPRGKTLEKKIYRVVENRNFSEKIGVFLQNRIFSEKIFFGKKLYFSCKMS